LAIFGITEVFGGIFRKENIGENNIYHLFIWGNWWLL